MDKNIFSNEKSDIKIERTILFKYVFSYAKKHMLGMLICLILIALFTLVSLINPIIIMVSIDDLINTRDRIIGVYHDAGDFTSIEYGDYFYSSIAPRYSKPDSTLRMIKNGQDYFFLDKDQQYGEKSEIITNNGSYYLKNGEDISLINKAQDNFVKALGEKNKENLLILAASFILLLLLSFGFEYAQGFMINVISMKIVNSMRTDLFERLTGLDMAYFETNPVGRLVTRLTNDVNNVSMMFSQVILVAIKDIAMMLGVAAIIFSINSTLALATFALFPFIVIALVLYRVLLLRIERKLKVQMASINAKLSEYISCIDVIQVFNSQNSFKKSFDEENLKYKKTVFKKVRLSAFFGPLSMFVNGVTLAIVLFVGSKLVGQGLIEVGVVVAFTNYIYLFFQPLIEFSNTFSILQSAIASLERMYIIFTTDAKITSPSSPYKLPYMSGKIEFRNVSFSYNDLDSNDSVPVLDDVSFTVKPGETLAIVGRTGSGKTTIISLIYRFYDVQKGEILIDDVPIKDLNLSTLRKNMAMVLQDVMIFSSSVKDNISLFDENMGDEDIKNAAKIVNSHEFIEKLEHGYEQILKESGDDLSMGERQLISFARAVSHQPTILILDEASANIDSETELLIQDAIEKMSSKRTMVVIAHRLSTIKNADQIIVLDKGKIIERGNHNELIKLNGAYKQLHDAADIESKLSNS